MKECRFEVSKNKNTMWVKINQSNPPKNVPIKTKIDDGKGERNIQELILQGNLWWTPDMKMYVYYTPTHWWKN